ncbi:MAG: hypothetical protein ACPK7O_06155 [Methanobacterium sp.]
MKRENSKPNGEEILRELGKIKLKGFRELENEDLKNNNLEDFKKCMQNEFKNYELKEFKKYVDEVKDQKTVEDIKIELNSNNAVKETIKDLESIGIDGKGPSIILKIAKRNIIN